MTSVIVTLSLQLYIKSNNIAPVAQSPVSSNTAELDSIIASQELTIEMIDEENQKLGLLVTKYEMALDAVRHANPELYRQFIRHAQFAEKYTTDHEDEFYKENLKYKSK
jgi:hypothetical protein